MQQLQNDCLDKPSWQSANDDPNIKTEVTDRRTHGGQTSRISKRQVQHIVALRLIAEKARRKGKKIFNCFVDFKKAFDSIDQTVTWAVLES